MVTKSFFTVALFCTILFVTSAAAQNEPKCDENEQDCPKSKSDTGEAVTRDLKPLVAAAKLPVVRFALRPEPVGPVYRPLSLAAKTEGAGQQTAADDPAALAKKLSNPVASLISFPFQSNFDFGLGPTGDGFKFTLNIQPVIPVSLNKDWNLISRTIVPVIYQSDVVGTSHQFGLGDTIQTLFFSPNKSEPFIWGLGPQILIPTATNEFLGTQKLGLGPALLVLKQQGPWTVGALTGHLWSVAGKSSRDDVNLTNLQPFIAFGTKSAWTFTLNTESTYDWKSHIWNVPVHFTVTKLVRFGKRPVSIGGGLRCWADSGPTGPTGCGFRFIVTPLFPRK